MDWSESEKYGAKKNKMEETGVCVKCGYAN